MKTLWILFECILLLFVSFNLEAITQVNERKLLLTSPCNSNAKLDQALSKVTSNIECYLGGTSINKVEFIKNYCESSLPEKKKWTTPENLMIQIDFNGNKAILQLGVKEPGIRSFNFKESSDPIGLDNLERDIYIQIVALLIKYKSDLKTLNYDRCLPKPLIPLKSADDLLFEGAKEKMKSKNYKGAISILKNLQQKGYNPAALKNLLIEAEKEKYIYEKTAWWYSVDYELQLKITKGINKGSERLNKALGTDIYPTFSIPPSLKDLDTLFFAEAIDLSEQDINDREFDIICELTNLTEIYVCGRQNRDLEDFSCLEKVKKLDTFFCDRPNKAKPYFSDAKSCNLLE